MQNELNSVKEANDLVGQAAQLIGEVRTSVEKQNSKLDCIQKDINEKMATQAAKYIEDANNYKANLAANEKRVDKLTRLAANAGSDSKNPLKSTFLKEYSDSLYEYFRTGDTTKVNSLAPKMPHELANTFCKLDSQKQTFANILTSGINPTAGYLVLPEIMPNMMGRVFETSPMRRICSTIQLNTAWGEIFIDDDEPGADEMRGELDLYTDTKVPEIGLEKVEVHDIMAAPKITAHLLQDAFMDVESWLMGKLARKFTRIENRQFVTGVGAKTARGFMNDVAYPDWTTPTDWVTGAYGVYQRHALETIPTINAGSVVLDDLSNLQGTLIPDYRESATWVMNRLTFTKLITDIKESVGRPLIAFDYMKDGVPGMMLLGSPVEFMFDIPSIGANSLAIAYGDFGLGYTVFDRLGITVIRDFYTPNQNVIIFKSYKRVGGMVTSYDSIKRLRVQ